MLCLRKWAQRYEVLCQHLAQVSLSPGLNADVASHVLVIRLLFQHSELPTFLSWPFKSFMSHQRGQHNILQNHLIVVILCASN